MTTLEDKILGEKAHNYCSSSEDEDEDSADTEKGDKCPQSTREAEDAAAAAPAEVNKWEGTSTNTGPKGVIKDWQRYKQLEIERRSEQEVERLALAKKLTLTVQSALDEERARAELDDPELAELLDDDFLLHYQKQRMCEMMQQSEHTCQFGQLIILRTASEFLDAVDNENKLVKVVVHLYEDHVRACRTMNSCLKELAAAYVRTKFCAIQASVAGMTRDFKQNALPALLVYKAGKLIGDYLKLDEQFGVEFIAEDVQAFLIEHGMLEDRSCVPKIIQESGVDDYESD